MRPYMDDDADLWMVVVSTAGAACVALVLVGLYYVGAWVTAVPRRMGGVLALMAGVGLVVASLRRMPE